jgi:hypothetical protein
MSLASNGEGLARGEGLRDYIGFFFVLKARSLFLIDE